MLLCSLPADRAVGAAPCARTGGRGDLRGGIATYGLHSRATPYERLDGSRRRLSTNECIRCAANSRRPPSRLLRRLALSSPAGRRDSPSSHRILCSCSVASIKCMVVLGLPRDPCSAETGIGRPAPPRFTARSSDGCAMSSQEGSMPVLLVHPLDHTTISACAACRPTQNSARLCSRYRRAAGGTSPSAPGKNLVRIFGGMVPRPHGGHAELTRVRLLAPPARAASSADLPGQSTSRYPLRRFLSLPRLSTGRGPCLGKACRRQQGQSLHPP